jgi:hypothetical protein
MNINSIDFLLFNLNSFGIEEKNLKWYIYGTSTTYKKGNDNKNNNNNKYYGEL